MRASRAAICGVPFLALFHHDGRFIRAPGLFAFARGRGERFEILHLERAAEICRRARPDHPRWTWALAAGMDTLLVHILGARPATGEAGELGEVTWAPGAEIRLGGRCCPRGRLAEGR
jgi:hypothetical protein